MRVAVDVTPLLGPVTGVGQTVRGLLGALPDAAPDVEVARWELTRQAWPAPPSVLVRLWARVGRPRGDRWLPEADVVHGTNFVVPPTARPATVTVHDCWCARSPGDCTPTIAAATATVRRAVDRGVWLHVSTEWGAAEVRELYGAERVRVVPFGVPAVAEAGPSPVDGPYVLALGASDRRKGHDVLSKAMADVPGVQLILAGSQSWVDDATRAALLRGATALAYPSRYEGFGFPVLEAMSVGVPVVASAVGGVPEVAGDAALLVAPDDPGALADALRTAVGDEAERSRLITAGHARASSFTWEAHARGMAQLWRDALEAA
ncbi:MAG: putative glycosyltransferase [Actinomycetia bacterium]|nr:putative glycosyltransferase [Actinomycetes bacterium]